METNANDLAIMVQRLNTIIDREENLRAENSNDYDSEVLISAGEIYWELKYKAKIWTFIEIPSYIDEHYNVKDMVTLEECYKYFTLAGINGVTETICIRHDSMSSDFYCPSLDFADSYENARDILHTFVLECAEEIWDE